MPPVSKLLLFDRSPRSFNNTAPLKRWPHRGAKMLSLWHKYFPDAEPVAHWLRDAFRDRWTRFHSLPGSKRYPEGNDEYTIIFTRHNRIMSELTGSDRKIVLLTTGYSETPEPVRNQPEWNSLDPAAAPWRSIPMHELENDAADDPNYWHVFASERDWQPDSLNPIIELIADEHVANVMIVSPDCRWLLHPYDGGMDLILESPAIRDHFKSLHPDWLSSRPDGM
jgi:hypothetical protein